MVKCELYLVVVLWAAARGLCGEERIKDMLTAHSGLCLDSLGLRREEEKPDQDRPLV